MHHLDISGLEASYGATPVLELTLLTQSRGARVPEVLDALAAVTVVLEDARWPGRWKTLVLFPLHLFIWWMLMLVALFYRDATWHDIPHTVRLSLSEIEAKHHTGRLMLRRPPGGKRDPEARTDEN